LTVGVLLTTGPLDIAAREQAEPCRPAGPLVRLAGLSEASGLAVSRRVPGRLWTHNDSGEPVVFALDSRGSVAGQLRLAGARVDDWEAIAVAECPAGSCLYIGDIGDNDARRKQIAIYRVPEPEASASVANVSDVFYASYPDGAHDAEALLISNDGRLHVMTKGETGPIALYRFPADLKPGQTHRLERVGAPLATKADAASRVTDAAVSADGQWAVVRTERNAVIYRAADLLAGQWREARRVDLAPLREPQGEGIAMAADNTIFVAGEGGGKGRPGTLGRFTCAPGR
jgi:hypothetical protein